MKSKYYSKDFLTKTGKRRSGGYLGKVALLCTIMIVGLVLIGLGYIYPAYVLMKADLAKDGGLQIVEVNPPRYELQSVCFEGTSYVTNGYYFKEEMTDNGFFVKCDVEE